jgi:hypothetical protein
MDTLYHAIQLPLFMFSKVCIKCLVEKPLDQFSKAPETKDGYRGACKECQREWRRSHARANGIPVRGQVSLETSERGSKICTKCGKEKSLEEFHKGHAAGGRTPTCKACVKQYHKEYRQENKEREKVQSHERYVRNRERVLKRTKDYRQTHQAQRRLLQQQYIARPEVQEQRHRYYATFREQYPQIVRERNQRWAQANPLKTSQYSRKRHAKKREVTTETVDYARILERDGWHCYICDQAIDPTVKKGPARLTFDHRIPVTPRPGEPQGFHVEDNIKPTHLVCNQRKGNKPFESLTAFQRRGPKSTPA